MATAKRNSKAGGNRSLRTDGDVSASIVGGNESAAAALVFRARQARNRKRLDARRTKSAPRATVTIPERTRSLLGSSPSVGTLLAEGDSWFDYPMRDILGILEDQFLYDVESVAHKGDCIEDMAYSSGQFAEFARRLEKLLRANRVPKAILLSGGGNDIAGDEFALLLNHATSALPTINDDIVRGVIDVRLRNAFAHIIGGLTTIAKGYLDVPIPIITHGYAYPVPDGRGFMGGWSFFPGPWLRPGFHKKGHAEQTVNTEVVARLIDRFNVMLESVSTLPEFGHVHYVDLRSTLISDAGYKKHWANELHPTKEGFGLVTAKIASVIAGL